MSCASCDQLTPVDIRLMRVDQPIITTVDVVEGPKGALSPNRDRSGEGTVRPWSLWSAGRMPAFHVALALPAVDLLGAVSFADEGAEVVRDRLCWAGLPVAVLGELTVAVRFEAEDQMGRALFTVTVTGSFAAVAQAFAAAELLDWAPEAL